MFTQNILESDSRRDYSHSPLIWQLPQRMYRKEDPYKPKPIPVRSPHPSIVRSSSTSHIQSTKPTRNYPGTPNDMSHSEFQKLLNPPKTMDKQATAHCITSEATDVVVDTTLNTETTELLYPIQNEHKIKFIKSLNLLCENTNVNHVHRTAISKTVLSVTPLQSSTPLLPPSCTIGAQKRTKRITDFTKLTILGEGAFGTVQLCLNNLTKKRLIIKSIYKERILVESWIRDRKLGTVPSEIHIMSTLNKAPHANIMPILDFFEDDEHCYIEMEPHGGQTGCIDLFDLIEHRGGTSEPEVKAIFRQVARSIEHLHRIGIVHRDIKDENFVVDSNGVVKLIDFGSAAYIKDGPFNMFVGTAGFAPPEVLNGGCYYGKSQDVWSLGILLYTLVFGENPFVDAEDILLGSLRLDRAGASVSEECLDMIRCLLSRDVAKRPDISDVVNSKWLNE